MSERHVTAEDYERATMRLWAGVHRAMADKAITDATERLVKRIKREEPLPW